MSTAIPSMPDALTLCVYGSSAVLPFSTAALSALLDQSRTDNQRQHITGMLLYKGGNFLQVLEGAHDAVVALLDRIVVDPRHRGFQQLCLEPLTARQFQAWSMGFQDLDRRGAALPPGFTDFLDRRFAPTAAASPGSLAMSFLDTFRRHM